MTRRGQDILLGGGVGLMLGLLPGLLAAGAVMTWRLGGDLREIDLVTWFRLLPAAARWQGLPLTAALVGAGERDQAADADRSASASPRRNEPSERADPRRPVGRRRDRDDDDRSR